MFSPRLSNSKSRLGLSPAKIALLYAVSSIVWISFSDQVVSEVFANTHLRLIMETTKGIAFVIVTAFLLYLLVSRLVGEMRSTQDSLVSREADYKFLAETTSEGICRVDDIDNIAFVNPRFAQLLQYAADDLIGKPISSFLNPDDTSAFEGQLTRWHDGASERADFRFRAANGSDIWVIISGTPIFGATGSYTGSFLMILDVTERRRIQEQLQHAQKMETVGRFAGGIAHDFNNLLSIIVGYASLLQSKIHGDEQSHEYARSILRASDRAAALVRQLLAFSRKQPSQENIVDLHEIASNIGKMLPRVIGDDINVVILGDGKPATVKSDPAQIEQLIMNLAVNARDAMPKGGTLTIETVHMEHMPKLGAEGLTDGDYSVLRVTDTGNGMDSETKSLIFEPFFTTKEIGKGTGLGLSMVYGIVKQGGGHIEVESAPGEGSTFSIYLPYTQPTLQKQVQLERQAAVGLGHETILLVEDEAELRSLTKHILTEEGYNVLEAADGQDALSAVEKCPQKVDLLLTDIVMPRMGGCELANRLCETYPSLRVLLMSGYADDEVLQVCPPTFKIIEKPITPPVLVTSIRQALDKNRET